LQDLERLDQLYGDDLDIEHIAAAFNSAGHLASGSQSRPASFHPLMRSLWRRLQPQLDCCHARALSHAVWACGKTGFLDAALLDSCLARLAAIAEASSADIEPQHISTALYSAALLHNRGYTPNYAHAEQLVEALIRQRHEANQQAVSNTLWAAAVMGLRVSKPQTQQLVEAMVQHIDGAKTQNLATTMWAAAALELHPWHLTQQLVAAMVQKRHHAQSMEIVNTLWAAANMRLEVADEQAELLVAALLQKPHNAQDIGGTAKALAILGCYSARAYVDLASAAQRQLWHMDNQGLCNLAWALAMADQQRLIADVLALCRQVGEDKLWRSSVREGLLQLHCVHLWLQEVQVGSKQGLAGVLSPSQLQQCINAWDQQQVATARQVRTEFKLGVYECCTRLSCLTDCRMEVCTPDNAYSIDVVAVHTGTKKLLAIEADGPKHFLEPSQRPTGLTRARNKGLAARGYVVVSVPHYEWNDVAASAKADYLRRKDEEAVRRAVVW